MSEEKATLSQLEELFEVESSDEAILIEKYKLRALQVIKLDDGSFATVMLPLSKADGLFTLAEAQALKQAGWFEKDRNLCRPMTKAKGN